jgi:ferric-chelate reductase
MDDRVEYYIWPAFLVWGLDRFLRLTRNIYFNVVRAAKPNAEISLASHDTVKVTFRRKMSWRPGQHAYITLPTVSTLPSESHPFTISSIPTSGDENSEVTFLVKSQGGMTRRLRELAAANESKVITIPAFIDGPYGQPPDLRSFSTCILLAGGSGITYTLPLLQDIVR